MKLGRNLLKKPLISVSRGSQLGYVEDLYLGTKLDEVVALYLGSEGILRRSASLALMSDVELLGEDVVLVRDNDVVQELKDVAQVALWTRLSNLRGREVDTTGGTRIGTIGDVIINTEGEVLGYALDRVSVKGPLSQRGAIPLDAVVDLGHDDGVMTIDLPKAEQHTLAAPE